MKRALLTLRPFASALLIVMGLMAISPAAHAAPLASPARSVSVTFRNNTTHNLTMRYCDVFSGEWTNRPRMYVSPSQEVYWGTVSDGFMTGTSGAVMYDMDDGKNFTLKWNDPYVGSNTYTFSGTALGAGGFKIIRSGGSGNNAQVTLTLQQN
jgi:hypothetical protein